MENKKGIKTCRSWQYHVRSLIARAAFFLITRQGVLLIGAARSLICPTAQTADILCYDENSLSRASIYKHK